MLDIQGLTAAYGRITALDGVDIRVSQGEIVSVVGSNGAGKSTLLRSISGLIGCRANRMTFGGAELDKILPHNRIVAGIAHVLEGRQIFTDLTVEENLTLGAVRRRDPAVADDLNRVYRQFPILAERRRQLAGGLSGGQQQMLAIGRAVVGKPKLLLLDEPSMGLAPLVVQDVMRTISALRDQGITILLVEQNAVTALAISDRGYVLENGRVVGTGTGRQLLADPGVQSAYLGI